MIISFDDEETHTTEVKIVRSAQGVDLGKLRDVHEIYKTVVHDLISVDEAMSRLDCVVTAKPKFNKWYVCFIYPRAYDQWRLLLLPCHVALSLGTVPLDIGFIFAFFLGGRYWEGDQCPYSFHTLMLA